EVGGNTDRPDDLAQIVGHWLASRDEQYRLVVDPALALVEHDVVVDHLAGERVVGIHQRRHRLVNHALGVPAHRGDAIADFGEFLIVGTNDVWRLHDKTNAIHDVIRLG